jgi:hypothetical protein
MFLLASDHSKNRCGTDRIDDQPCGAASGEAGQIINASISYDCFAALCQPVSRKLVYRGGNLTIKEGAANIAACTLPDGRVSAFLSGARQFGHLFAYADISSCLRETQ